MAVEIFVRQLPSPLIGRSAVALVCMLSGIRALAGTPPDDTVDRGAHLARQICSNCHVVADDQPVPPRLAQATPSFREIANRPGTNEKALRHFIATTHWDEKTVPVTMPNLEMTPEQISAVARYIMSLRAPTRHNRPG